jgi:NifB/MoaA-like Fe-S oxidoreductase
LTGSDLEKALAGELLGTRLLIPSCMLRREGDLFLDDMTPSALGENLGILVSVVPSDGRALAEALMKGGCC